ncbi:MAG: alpha/beta fold hydrolase [Candidatus Heimdallarchaeota archaeon]
MSAIKEKSLKTRGGSLSYYLTEKTKTDLPRSSDITILFIHGLGQNKRWLLGQYEDFDLAQYRWLVPDLMGYGTSSKPRDFQAYRMDQQAANLERLLLRENVDISKLVIMAHSMGGPIAVSLLELLLYRSFPGIPLLLLYVEGNLDYNDAFVSSKIAKYTLSEFEVGFNDFLKKYPPLDPANMQVVGPFVLWASSRDLASVSKEGTLFSRIQATKVRTVFVFGEKNRGRFTSEELVKESGLPLYYVPGTGHFMHLENPGTFWKTITEILTELR